MEGRQIRLKVNRGTDERFEGVGVQRWPSSWIILLWNEMTWPYVIYPISWRPRPPVFTHSSCLSLPSFCSKNEQMEIGWNEWPEHFLREICFYAMDKTKGTKPWRLMSLPWNDLRWHTQNPQRCCNVISAKRHWNNPSLIVQESDLASCTKAYQEETDIK